MATLQVSGPDFSVAKQKAIEDAQRMQDAVYEECTKAGKPAPEYRLSELIGKGSFGRVYKATSLKTKQLLAVKIIDIEQSDTLDPASSDTYSDLLKEINALKLLNEGGARNVNLVIEALPVGQTMWIITEYCAGGSVATLMKPTLPGGLQEKWIIPILREVAEAVFWVHKQGVIHRDIKCANILVTESGGVQLCDFGVSGIIETKLDKRSTVVGTPHWMAPELFSMDSKMSYGTEVDIWAFGAMTYEIAAGYPPNLSAGMDLSKLVYNLKQRAPRLEGDVYSAGLKDLVAYCLEDDPAKRPTIEKVQRHPYIFGTLDQYPTSSLALLVRAYKLWEAQGGIRQSLFGMGGAQGLSENMPGVVAEDEWNFSTTAAFDQQVFKNTDAKAVFDVYGDNVDFSSELLEEHTARLQRGKQRRRPPPQLPVVKAPLEKVFDPNTMSNYLDNSRQYYGRMPPPPTSDLPLRDESSRGAEVRESLIDLDASLHGDDLARFVDMETLRAGPRASAAYDPDGHDVNKPPLSDPADLNNNRRTRDWKFPPMGPPPASANPEMTRFALNEESAGPPSSRPQMLHHPTEPVTSRPYNDLPVPDAAANRVSTGSLIDLDMGVVDPSADLGRPSTSHSDAASMSSSDFGAGHPFELDRPYERQPSLYVPREPSIYVSDESDYTNQMAELAMNDGRPSSSSSQNGVQYDISGAPFAGRDYGGPVYLTPQPLVAPDLGAGQRDLAVRPLPPAPAPPSLGVMQGQASAGEVKEELRRMAMGLGEHLSHANAYLSNLPVRRVSARPEPVGEGQPGTRYQ